MSARVEQRLREILRERREGRHTSHAPVPDTIAEARRRDADTSLRAVADTLGGDVLEGDGGVAIVVERFYPADHQHGLLRIGDVPGCAMATAPELSLLGGVPEPIDRAPRALLFVDLETTGLAGGAGTYAFLVGCAFFEPHGFRIRQYFLPGYQHERRLLAEVEALVRGSAALVSYNGKSFDVPVLETRYQFNRLAPPFDGVSHVDMLHPARRFWRGVGASPGAWPETDSCRLSVLERTLFGVRRIGDVPGHEIPGRYFDFMRSGDASPLEPVLEHNRLDLISLAALTARAVRLLAGAPASSTSARESLGAGRLLERGARLDAAKDCYRDAAERARYERGPDAAWTRADALRALAVRCRRDGRHDQAAEAWEAIAVDRRTPAGIRREALEALAIHFEHRARDLDQARRFAQLSLVERGGTHTLEHGRHRLARLDKKLGRVPAPDGTGALWLD
ncbi:MAG: ribonuclease H-like domain-containing protein [Vicinamibacteria bacterium]|nr:ribonuclease H-like domain-containing protein [Vicinamibacteria bacterium]